MPTLMDVRSTLTVPVVSLSETIFSICESATEIVACVPAIAALASTEPSSELAGIVIVGDDGAGT